MMINYNSKYISKIPDIDSEGRAAKEYIQFYRDIGKAFSDPTLDMAEYRRLFEKWGDCSKEPGQVDYIDTSIDGVKCLWAVPHKCADDKVIICIHGGGYIYGNRFSHRKSYAHLAKKSGCKGLIVDYRNTPENAWPAPVEDVIKVYKWLLANNYKPENIAITGDSCGGAMALTIPLYLKEQNLPMLAASMPICPWCDTMATTPIYNHNDKDVMNTKESVISFGMSLKDDGLDVEDPHLAPIHLTAEQMKGFPPIYIQVGGYENFVDESVIVADTAYKAGLDIKLDIVGHMQHSFTQLAGSCKDADIAIDRYAAWIKPILKVE
ncbi:Acetyl esterase/lipase [Dethiosulfatibacter aminovorans DSM 17477]|uniref:Acetyl esterase/lipase n=1 Tax=Dethiosulfatibacter aminovorans DSM 17477 TaxID=1121476 RepID=A0A1M6ENE6_9FIRM|nr:alpha/beta hydrolase [Dethiosulfatibacter aminovorans]SHI86790.1 Acetyl esterase/lipase [Dethiosulfatibacter aminovorans DSM 17477]